jgi:hypothetical protein
MRRQGAATPGAAHRVYVGCAPSLLLPRQPRTAPLKRLPLHRSPWQRKFGGRHPGSTAENAAAGRGNPGAHSPDVCGMCPQPPLAAAVAHRPAQALAACSPAQAPRRDRKMMIRMMVQYCQNSCKLLHVQTRPECEGQREPREAGG